MFAKNYYIPRCSKRGSNGTRRIILYWPKIVPGANHLDVVIACVLVIIFAGIITILFSVISSGNFIAHANNKWRTKRKEYYSVL